MYDYTAVKQLDIEISDFDSKYCRFVGPQLRAAGVYLLVIDRQVVYIGKSKNLYMRWAMGYCVANDHMNGSTNKRINMAIKEAAISNKHPELWFIATNDLDELEEALIREYQPCLNIEFTIRDRRAS